MCAYADGDSGAFERLYQRHKGALYRYLLRQIAHEATVAEQFQEVWSKVIRHRARYQAGKNQAQFKTWLYTIARHQVVDYYRAQGRYKEWQQQQVVDEPALAVYQHAEPEQCQSRSAQAQRIRQSIASLPPPQRDAFLLKEEAGLSLAQIAQTTGVDRETVKSRLRYAVNKLREQLQMEWGEA